MWTGEEEGSKKIPTFVRTSYVNGPSLDGEGDDGLGNDGAVLPDEDGEGRNLHGLGKLCGGDGQGSWRFTKLCAQGWE